MTHKETHGRDLGGPRWPSVYGEVGKVFLLLFPNIGITPRPSNRRNIAAHLPPPPPLPHNFITFNRALGDKTINLYRAVSDDGVFAIPD